MRLPGTLRALLAQVKASPVPIGSISIPTKGGPVVLTFGEERQPLPAIAPPAKMAPTVPTRQRDTVGAFKTPPIGRELPWQPVDDGAA